MAWDGPKWDARGMFSANPDLANILGRTDLDFENFHFLDLLDPKFPDCQVSKFWISKHLDFPTSKHLDFLTSPNLDFPAAQIWIGFKNLDFPASKIWIFRLPEI